MNTHNEILIDVHGSCVSYSVLSKKDAVSTLLSSSADYLFIDFYDMARSQWAY